MIPLPLTEIEALCPGRLERSAEVGDVTGVQIDSRRVSPGDLFVAVGDGEAYVGDALERGARAALVPEDAVASLAALGRAVRNRSHARVVAITGSTGKTSTKDILAAICSPRVRTVAAEASYNNELGVPLTLCRLERDTEVCIVELAMRGPGQIAELCEIARPHIGVVTNVGPAHLELVGSLEAVVRAKGELLAALPAGGTAIVPEAFPLARDDLDVVRFGEPDARLTGGSTLVRFEGVEVEFDFRSRHQATNALVALLAARALGIDVTGSVEVAFSRWRGEEVTLRDGSLLINDCWNANPLSMQAALEHLVDRAEGRRPVAVLGGMAELGPEGLAYHREIGALAAALGVQVIVAVGTLAESYLDTATSVPVVRWVPTADAAAGELAELLEPGDCILVKGSRAVGLEAVAEALAGIRI